MLPGLPTYAPAQAGHMHQSEFPLMIILSLSCCFHPSLPPLEN